MKLKSVILSVAFAALLPTYGQTNNEPLRPPPSDARPWALHREIGMPPRGNWIRQGTTVEVVPYLRPNDQATLAQQQLNVIKYLKTGQGAVGQMTNGVQFMPVSNIRWFDVVTTTWPYSGRVNSGKTQLGSTVALALKVITTNKTSLLHIECGGLTSEWQPDSSILFLGNTIVFNAQHLGDYTYNRQGFTWGEDNIKGTGDDSVYFEGEVGYAPINELYYTGFYVSRLVQWKSEFDNVKEALQQPNLRLVMWYRGWDVETEEILFQVRVDLPIEYSVGPPEVQITRSPNNQTTVWVIGLPFHIYTLESSTTPNGPWHSMPFATGRYTFTGTNAIFFRSTGP